VQTLPSFSPAVDSPELPLWAAPPPAEQECSILNKQYLQIKEYLAAAPTWDKPTAQRLGHHYATYGCGILGRYIAFKWQEGALHGISHPDVITLSALIGYADIREQVIDNTRQFLHGYPANNLLLYGDRGTGKSSTVKALLNEYWPRGLRLVEVPKRQLADYQLIVQQLRYSKHRFILFVDDLSFEENETEFKDLKALLEGGVEDQPGNVLIYATSNRRHLIKETFADRTNKNDTGREIHSMDSVQEKLSLADRFGITVIFPTPDQETFLEIAVGLAQKRQLPLSQQDLRRRALKWSIWHNGRSPRSARQFVDHLEGQLAMENPART
jgi:predicted AAA+ superfamily ATPase